MSGKTMKREKTATMAFITIKMNSTEFWGWI